VGNLRSIQKFEASPKPFCRDWICELRHQCLRFVPFRPEGLGEKKLATDKWTRAETKKDSQRNLEFLIGVYLRSSALT
jgi:hypothetical protein